LICDQASQSLFRPYSTRSLDTLRLNTINAKNPNKIPAAIDSTGNPGIPPPVTLDVVVVIFVLVVDVTETKVEIKVVDTIVETDPVETTVDVEVVVMSPPKGANLRIVESAFVEIVVKPGLDPTIHPPLCEVIYTELRTGGICPRIAGAVVI